MKLPTPPPSWSGSISSLSKARLNELLPKIPALSKADRYLHWEELRRRPAPSGITSEEWWLALKLGRGANLRSVPLRDKSGQPFQFGTPDEVAAQLHEIDRGLGFALNLPDGITAPETKDHYIVSSLMQESITSSQLEGAATTREVAKEMLRTGRPPQDKSERMILNNYATMQRIQSLRTANLSPTLVLELHALVTADTLSKPNACGRLRLPDENVRVEDEEGNVFHTPPPATELPMRVQAMCDFANGQTPDYFIHPVMRAIILHFWLAYDHPFVDGNGRTARALFYWSMLRQGYGLFEFISISQILLRAPMRYARAFVYTETDENDLTYFILHQTQVIREAVEALHAYVKHKSSQLHAAAERLRGLEGLNHRQHALLAHALREPGARYIIEGHRKSHNVSFQTARTDLFSLMEKGLLVGRKEGRFNVFYAPADLGEKLAGLSAARTSIAPSHGPTDPTLPLNLPFKTKHD
ncbi:MAG: Fic family protein [Nibricoccus sp.]